MKKEKKILAVLLIVMVLLSMVACGGGETPEKAVSNMLDAVKGLDSETAEKYIDYDTLMGPTEEVTEESAEDQVLKKLFFAKLSYEIVSSEETDEGATVTVKITNIDMADVFKNMLQKALPLAFSGLSDEEMEQQISEIFTELISDPDAKMATNTVDVKLEKKDDQWKIELTDELTDAIFGGLLSGMKDMSNAFGGGLSDDTL